MGKCIVTTKEGTTFEADARKGKYYEFFGAKVVYNPKEQTTAAIVTETVKETKTKQVKKSAENKVKPKNKKK